MGEIISIQEYINKRLASFDIIDSVSRQFSPREGEIVVGVVIKERMKKLFHLSKKLDEEMKTLFSKIKDIVDKPKAPLTHESRFALFELNRLECVKRIVDAEFEGSLYYEFPQIKDHLAANMYLAVQKDWRVVVMTGEKIDRLSEFLFRQEIQEKFIVPPSMS